MKIKAISVTQLFGIFNHVIPLNTEERVTIIHGCNGFGKTVLLNMIDGLFNRRYSIFRDIPFANFRVEFEGNSYIEVIKSPQSGSSEPNLTCRFGNDVAEQVYSGSLSKLIRENEEKAKELVGVTVISAVFSNAEKEEDSQKNFSEWIAGIKVRMVGIERLQQLPRRNTRGKDETTLAVSEYAEELVQKIRARLTEFAALSQKLDQSFPTRLFQESPHSALTGEDLQRKLEQLEKRRAELKDVGLLDREAVATSQLSSFQDEELAKRVLPIYIQDVEQKLNVFNQDRLADKLQKFKDIINRDFYYKQMTIDKERGVIFTASTGELLSANHLSSGEQHLFVLFYELLFKVEPHSLLLIDEPEQSLHLEWQREFLEEVQEIIQLVDCEVLMATHSPSIIDSRWDLTVGLKMKEPSHELCTQ